MATTIHNTAEQAEQGAKKAIRATLRAANEALDGLSNTVDKASPRLSQVADRAENLAHRGFKAAREGSGKLRDQTLRASGAMTKYMKEKPAKSMLIAAAAGAVLVGLASLLRRS